MQNLKPKLNNFLHRHPWALQFALALTLAVIAVGATTMNGMSGASAAPLPPGFTGKIVFDNPTSDQVNMRLGEVHQIYTLVQGSPIPWGPADVNGNSGQLALYLNNGDQSMVVGVKDVKRLDFETQVGVSIEHLFGSTNFRLGYPDKREYWFEAQLHYDKSDMSLFYAIPSGKFQINPAGYTVAFDSPAKDGSSVWRVGDTQPIQYGFIPKVGIKDPFRVENRLDLYLNKNFLIPTNNHFYLLQRGISIPAGFDTNQTKSLSWFIDPKLNFPTGEDLWVTAEIGTTFSGEKYKSANFQLVNSTTVNFTFPTTGSTIYLGNIYNLAFNRTPSSADPLTLILQGEGGIDQKTRKTLAEKQVFNGGSLTWAWDTNYFTDPQYGFYLKAYGAGKIFATLNSDGTQELGQSGQFNFGRLVEFTPTAGSDEPQDGTFNWPGALPPALEYTAGSTQTVNFRVDTTASHWTNFGTAATQVGLYFKKSADTSWTQLPTAFAVRENYTYDWQIPASTEAYSGELMVVVTQDGSMPNPANPRYFAKTYPFNVVPAASPALASATYYSQSFDVSTNSIGPAALDSFKANFHQTSASSDVSFGIGFFDSQAQPVWTNQDYPDSFNSEGYLIISSEREDELTSNTGYLLGWLQSSPRFNQIRSVRISIKMSTSDITIADQPWVSDVSLMYTAADGNGIGIINFVDAPVNDKVTKTVPNGTTGTFQIRVTPTSNFTGQALLNVGPITQVDGTSEDVTGKITVFINPNPVDLSGGVVDLPIAFTVVDLNIAGLYQFDVFGHDAADSTRTLTPAVGIGQIEVVNAANAITLSLTIPVEGGKPADATKAHPRFTFRLYNPTTKILDKTGLITDAQNQVSVIATHTELPAGTYTAYARSDRHLWSKSTQTNLVVTDTTTTASLTFPTLKAGNLNDDNKINSLDLPPATEYGVANLWSLGDLNNDGKINIMDLSFIMNFNYSLFGDKLPDENR